MTELNARIIALEQQYIAAAEDYFKKKNYLPRGTKQEITAAKTAMGLAKKQLYEGYLEEGSLSSLQKLVEDGQNYSVNDYENNIDVWFKDHSSKIINALQKYFDIDFEKADIQTLKQAQQASTILETHSFRTYKFGDSQGEIWSREALIAKVKSSYALAQKLYQSKFKLIESELDEYIRSGRFEEKFTSVIEHSNSELAEIKSALASASRALSYVQSPPEDLQNYRQLIKGIQVRVDYMNASLSQVAAPTLPVDTASPQILTSPAPTDTAPVKTIASHPASPALADASSSQVAPSSATVTTANAASDWVCDDITSWDRTHCQNKQTHCTRDVTIFAADTLSSIDSTVDACHTLPTGESYCKGPEIEYIERCPTDTPPSTASMLGSAVASGFALSFISQAAGDALRYNGYSQTTIQVTQMSLNAVIIAATGSWVPAVVSTTTSYLGEKAGLSPETARAAGNALAFFAGNMTPVGAGTMALNYAGGHVGSWCARQLSSAVIESLEGPVHEA